MHAISSAAINIAVARRTFRGNSGGGIYSDTGSPSTTVVSVLSSTISGHTTASGIFADGSGVKFSIAKSSVTGNNYGLAQGTGALFESLRDNTVTDNGPGGDVFGTITTLSGL